MREVSGQCKSYVRAVLQSCEDSVSVVSGKFSYV